MSIIVIVALLSIIALLTGIVGIVCYSIVKSSKSKSDKINNAYTTGTIMLVNNQSNEVMIQYSVGKHTYTLTEKIQCRTEDITAGDIVVGQKQVPLVSAQPGQSVIIMYNRKKPEWAIWLANTSEKQ